MEQRIEPLRPDEVERVEAQRRWVREHYTRATTSEFESLQGKLRVIDIILREHWVAAEETVKLQCLGIAFGDALVQRLGLKWVAVEDEYGRDPALQLEGTSILLFPLTTISKRIERGESVDVYDLFERACGTVERIVRESTQS